MFRITGLPSSNLTLLEDILVASYLLKRERKAIVDDAQQLMRQLDTSSEFSPVPWGDSSLITQNL